MNARRLLLFAWLALAAPVRLWSGDSAAAVAAGNLASFRDELASSLRKSATQNVDAAGLAGEEAALALVQHELLRQLDAASLEALGAAENRPFAAWLLSNRDALEAYVTAADLTQQKKGRLAGLLGWRKIWEADPASRTNGPWLRCAAAIAVSFAEGRKRYGEEIAPESRYEFFRTEAQTGRILPYFFEAPAWELVLTVHGNDRPNDELEWALDVTPPSARNQRDAGNIGHRTMAYRLFNYRDISVQDGTRYYDWKRNSLALAMEYGAVCGGISGQNSAMANAHGLPSFTVGQPGHCAYVYKSDRDTWAGGNFVSGWAQTHDSHQQPFWFSRYSANVNLVSDAFEHAGFLAAERFRWLAAALRPADAAAAAAALAAATRSDPLHVPAWQERVGLAAERGEKDSAALRDLAAGIIRAFTNYPVAMVDLLGPAEKNCLWPRFTETERTAYAAGVVRGVASMDGRKQWDLDDPALRTFLQRQFTLLGIADRSAGVLVDGRVQKFRPADSKEEATPWAAIPPAQRGFVEKHLRALSDAAESKPDALRAVVLAYLTLTAEDPVAGPRALAHYKSEIQSATSLARLEPLASATLAALKQSADQRADLVAAIRSRLARIQSFDAARLQSLHGQLGSYDFRERNLVGRWSPGDFAAGGAQTMKWDVSAFGQATDDYAIHLCFRWATGTPVTVTAVRLLENGKEISAEKRKSEAVDEAKLPAVYTLALRDPKAGARYEIEADVEGGGRNSAGLVMGRGERQPAFQKDEFAGIGSWGGKTWKEWPEVTEGWHEGEFDVTQLVKKPGPLFVRFQYGSYAGIQVMNVRLCENGRQIAQDLHVGRVMGNVNNQFSLALAAPKPGAKYTVKALLSHADGYGTVYLRKQI